MSINTVVSKFNKRFIHEPSLEYYIRQIVKQYRRLCREWERKQKTIQNRKDFKIIFVSIPEPKLAGEHAIGPDMLRCYDCDFWFEPTKRDTQEHLAHHVAWRLNLSRLEEMDFLHRLQNSKKRPKLSVPDWLRARSQEK